MSRKPRVLVVGFWLWPWYQEVCARALEKNGCCVGKFGWAGHFFRFVPGKSEPVDRSLVSRFQNKFLIGPTLMKLNLELIKKAEEFQPDIFFFYSATHIFPETVKKLRQRFPGACFAQYSNDNPFSKKANAGLFRNIIGSIPQFDMHFVFRKSNLSQFEASGAKRVFLLPPYFVPETDFPLSVADIDPALRSDVVFAGHFENDGRLDCLEEIVRRGFSLKLCGGGWDRAKGKMSSDAPLLKMFPIQPAVGDDYRKVICGSKIALCFLSKLNEDTYTRRSFQIPAMRAFLLSEYTADLAAMFREGEEIEFFRTKGELLEKISYYLSHHEERERIAKKGFERVWADRHDVRSRMGQFLERVRDHFPFPGEITFAAG